MVNDMRYGIYLYCLLFIFLIGAYGYQISYNNDKNTNEIKFDLEQNLNNISLNYESENFTGYFPKLIQKFGEFIIDVSIITFIEGYEYGKLHPDKNYLLYIKLSCVLLFILFRRIIMYTLLIITSLIYVGYKKVTTFKYK